MSHIFLSIPFLVLLLIINVLSIIFNDNVTPPKGKLGYENLINAT
ncbi:hypothetical protein DMN91_011635, partial [Ooceraea biroi]